MEAKTTDDVRGWLGWAGDVRDDSREWISDGRLLFRLSALSAAEIQSLRSVLGVKHLKRREQVDEHGFEARLVNFQPVNGMDEESDVPYGQIDLSTDETTWRFSEAYMTRLVHALPGAALYVAKFRDDGQAVPTGHALVAKRDGEIVGILMGIIEPEEVSRV
jgi:hypothetical protein